MNWIQPARWYIRTDDDRYYVSKAKVGDAWSYAAWGPKGTQDIGWLQAHLAICLRELNIRINEGEAQIARDGRALLGCYGTAAEAKQACEEHANQD